MVYDQPTVLSPIEQRHGTAACPSRSSCTKNESSTPQNKPSVSSGEVSPVLTARSSRCGFSLAFTALMTILGTQIGSLVYLTLHIRSGQKTQPRNHPKLPSSPSGCWTACFSKVQSASIMEPNIYRTKSSFCRFCKRDGAAYPENVDMTGSMSAHWVFAKQAINAPMIGRATKLMT